MKKADTNNHPILEAVDFHGGITWSRASEESGMSEVPAGHWIVGFDCAHASDFVPAWRTEIPIMREQEYRNINYVRNEIEDLATQLKIIERTPDSFSSTLPSSEALALDGLAARMLWTPPTRTSRVS